MKCLITGVASISSLGRDEATIVENLKKELVTIEPFQHDDPKTKTTFIAPCVDNTEELAPDVPRSFRTDHVNMQYATIKDALADAEVDLEAVDDPLRVGLCSGIGAGDMPAMRSAVGLDYPRIKPFDFNKITPTGCSGPLSTLLKLKGSVQTVQHACATGLRAVTAGMDLIALGKADMVICVSTEKMIPEGLRGFDAMRALYRGEDIAYASVPFAKERAGFTHGEGAGCIILETEEHFLKRTGGKGKVYGQTVAYADYSDGEDIVNPSGIGATNSLNEVLRKMDSEGLRPDFISAHATSTPAGDIVEAAAISDTLGADVPVVAFKRLVGHTITASGILELIYSLYQMKHGFIVSNGSLDPDPALKPIYLPKEQLNVPIESFVKNSFGFGGLNSVLGVTKYVGV